MAEAWPDPLVVMALEVEDHTAASTWRRNLPLAAASFLELYRSSLDPIR